ncbi:hypothetical protein Tdes44962_MAKER05435 [Teratosphaeria destructans]|uniref:Uncharacterized protein n=1 Tax=Teratosphaeria destructans TaxID=418781 RepID=A0A9W7SJZ0_9PEZI|nr:hypothetical protein Tdes44962_MAKER05435 [Teratosphaeria destructans]
MDYDALQAALAAMQAERDTLQHGRMPRSVPSAETNSHESAGAVTGSKCPERSGCAFQSTSPSAASKGSSTLLRKLPSRRCQCSSSDLREDDMCAPGHKSFSGGPSMDYKGHVEKHIRSLSIGFDKSLFLNALDTTAEREMREMLNDEVEGQTLKTLEAIHDCARNDLPDEWLTDLSGFFRLRLKCLGSM